MAFDNGVAVPGGASYTAPLLDFTDIGKLPSVYRQAGFDAQQKEQNSQQQQLNAQRIADNQRQAEIAQTFKGGLPIDPATGAIDYKKAVAMLAQRGDTGALWNGADAMLSQSATNMSPMLTGGSQPSQGAPQGQPTSIPAKPLPPPAAGSPQGDPGMGTIASIVTDRLPGQDAVTGQTIAKIAQTMGVDPNATLTPGQLRRAQGLIQRYAPATETPAGKPQASADAGPGGQGTSFKDRFGGDGGTLPPSANAVQPAPPAAAAPASADGGRSPAGQPQAGAPASVAPQFQSNLPAADASLKLTPQEKALYRRHLTNLTGSGGVDNPDGTRSTLKDITVESEGKTYVIPTVYGGKVVPNDEAWKRAKTHLKDFPSYANDAEASARYGSMHQYMEQDTAQFLGGRAGASGAQGQPQGAPAQQPPQAPQPAPIGAPAPQPQAQPQQQPLRPQVPLPKGFSDPQAAILALRTEAARLSANPRARGQVDELKNWAERIEQSIQPVEMSAGKTMLDPKTGQPLYQGNQPTLSPDAVNAAAERYLETGQLPPNLGRGVQGSATMSAIQNHATELAQQRGIDMATLPQKWQQFKARQVAIQRFTSGKQGDTTRSFNVLVDHLDTLTEAAAAMKNGDVRLLNKWKNDFAAARGESAPTNFDGVKALVGDEIVKAVVGSAGALADREEVKKDLDRASSPKQLFELIERYKKLALGQLKGLRKQYETATGLKNFGDMLLPGTLTALGGGEGGKPAAAPDKDGWVTLPNGARIQEVK